jgi:Ala-tRNA(Pro) deacylase
MFDDCAEGAIPPLGDAYGYEVILDNSLASLSDVYFEAGSHTDLVHLSGNDFRALMSNAVQGVFSQPI